VGLRPTYGVCGNLPQFGSKKGASGRIRYLHCGDFTDNQRPVQPDDRERDGVGFGYYPTLPLTWATLA
jgi:hypothetical protein